MNLEQLQTAFAEATGWTRKFSEARGELRWYSPDGHNYVSPPEMPQWLVDFAVKSYDFRKLCEEFVAWIKDHEDLDWHDRDCKLRSTAEHGCTCSLGELLNGAKEALKQ